MVVDESLFVRLHLRSFGPELFRSVESIICESFFYKLFSVFPVDASALRLSVRGMGMLLGCRLDNIALSVNSLVRNDSAPVQCFDYIFFRSRDKPLGIGVFNPYDEISSVLFGVEIVVQSCPYSSHVQGSGRRRSKPYSCSSFHISLVFVFMTVHCHPSDSRGVLYVCYILSSFEYHDRLVLFSEIELSDIG